MPDEPSFKMSQDYELIPLKKQRAYPILIEEWCYLKENITKIGDDANFYHTIGSVLLGVAGSALVAALTLDLPKPQGTNAPPMPIVFAWFIFVAALVWGSRSFFRKEAARSAESERQGSDSTYGVNRESLLKWRNITLACRRPPIASARASLRPLAAPEAQRYRAKISLASLAG